MSAPRRYSVVVAKDYLKFAAAHFIAYPGFREPLHGHNYQVSVRVEADLGPDGYVLDFGLVKRVAKALCEELDERVLLPERSDCLVLTRTEDAVEVRTEAGHRFRFPAADVRLLPIAHSSAEELAAYLLARLREALSGEAGGRGLAALEGGVAEAPGEVAYCRGPCCGGSCRSWRSRPAAARRCPIRTRRGRACSASAAWAATASTRPAA